MPHLQAFGEEALQQGAIAVAPSVNPVTDNADTSMFQSPGIAYYINDRFVIRSLRCCLLQPIPGVVFQTSDSSVRQMLLLADFSTDHSVHYNRWTTTAHACMHDLTCTQESWPWASCSCMQRCLIYTLRSSCKDHYMCNCSPRPNSVLHHKLMVQDYI